ncbi:hypothetical protein N9B82_03275 [Saprospiraceae bacterium]|nr:hypothetical protein [Saprospiraceae bacterium]
MMLYKLIFASCLFFVCQSSFGQFGISTEFRHYPINDWEAELGENNLDVNYGISLDYWMRLKNYRWEMMPTLSGSWTPNSTNDNVFGITTGRFQIKNNLYLLDFKNDCNCPTFSKQSGWFKKSFFFQVAPAYSFNHLNTNRIETKQDNYHLFELGLGAGFDFGISDLITISPYFNYVITNRFANDRLSTTDEEFKTNLNHLVVGLRLGLRPDYARPNNVRRRNLRY